MNTKDKISKLESLLSDMGSLVIAFSGGVDSTFLLFKASQTVNLKYTALTVRTPYMPEREISEAIDYCKNNKINHTVMDVPFPEIIRHNPEDRCYLCKKQLFGFIRKFAADNGYKYIADGTNADDMGEYRPGLKALGELEIHSPLAEAGLSKQEIRDESKKHSLPTWDKPAYACLLTRLPHNNKVLEEDIKMIEKAEQFLFERGFYGTRVRLHGDTARIECMPGYLTRMTGDSEREKIVSEFKKIGFRFISLDMEGYRSGSMNPKKDTQE